MAKYKSFEDLPVWQEAARLYNRVLDLLEEPNLPLSAGFRNQLDRAALSISNNVAEGFERVTTNELLSIGYLGPLQRSLCPQLLTARRAGKTAAARWSLAA